MLKANDIRPDPDELLKEANREIRGKLTIFLGCAAGVGKTFSMLETAHDKINEGTNVIIGWLETHGRIETEKLTEGITCIKPMLIRYREKELQEMDIDAILKTKPELVLVDELAHTNIPGSRHVRRFQDVEELLNAGIDVYTTLNIQHIESLNDVVSKITGVIVHETVPDYIVENANNIRLIDIPPEDLIKRFQEGKVYVNGQAEQALRSFFRVGNINALRELTLRFTASRVDNDMAAYMRSNRIDGPWPASGRVMVCVSASPFSAHLIRAAKRLSEGLRADFLAVHIQTSDNHFPMGDKELDRITRNMRLAEELGGKTLTIVGNDLTNDILDVANKYNVTSIVVGKPCNSRLWELLHGSLVDKLIRKSSGVNVYVIQSDEEKDQESAIKTVSTDAAKISWLHTTLGLLMAAGITVISWLLEPQLELVNIALLYLLPVLLTAIWWGRWSSYITAVGSVLAFDFLFVPPLFEFTVYDIRYLWSFIIFLVVSFLIGGRTEMLKQEVYSAKQREKSVRALYEFSRQIAAITDSDYIAQELSKYSKDTIDRETVVLIPSENESLVVKTCCSNAEKAATEKKLPESEFAVASWVYEHGQIAGRSTETLPGARYLFVPLISGNKTRGVFGILVDDKKINAEEKRLIDAWAGLTAIAIERISLAKAARQAELMTESDKIRNIVFNSISHELRTPLSTIIGSASALLDKSIEYSRDLQRELLETIQDGATRMERLVANLLDTARLESGHMTLKIDWCDLEDIIGIALRQLGDITKKYNIIIKLPENLPLIRADETLLEQVLLNLFDNALKYSPVGSNIFLTAILDDANLRVSISDNGPGIPTSDIEHIFDKFYRAKQSIKISGTGLGLSICKSIIEAHKGNIWAENIHDGGAKISFVLPINLDEVPTPSKAGGKYE